MTILTRIWKVLKITILTLVTLGALSLAGGVFYIHQTLQDLPKIDILKFKTFGTSKILDADGNVIWEPTDKTVLPMTYEEIPILYKDSIIAVEDKDFWTNKGFSYKAVANIPLGYARKLIDSSYEPRGGSTLEQQLIKNTYYNGGIGYNTIKRKIHELFLSRQMDETMSKEDILTYYVNKLELGEGSIGIKSAMAVYFNKSPEQYAERTPENIAQIAYLVGLGQAPTTYNLYLDSESANERTQTVLGVMLDANLITEDEYNEASKVDLVATLAPRYHRSEAQRLTNLKYKIYTDAVLSELIALGYDWNNATLTVQTFMQPSTYDSITNTVRNASYLDDEQQIAVTVVNKDGVVIGMVGGRSETDELNRAVQQTRSSGSSLKGFTAYGPLLQYFGNQYNTASTFDTSPYLYPGTSVYMNNYANAVYGSLDIQQALRWSLNTPVARIDDEILGSTRMKTFLHGLGLDVKETYSANDGIGLNVSTLQAAAAYNALNNGGVYIKPRFVDKITFVDGTVKTIEASKQTAMNESTAFVLTQMLRGVPQPGMGSAMNAQIPQYSGYAAKTGLVAFDPAVNPPAPYGYGSSDAWFNSITNEGYSISIWTGYDEPNTSPQVPDNYKGQQELGRDLQLLLNGDRAVTNWTQPNTVRLLSGSDLRAHYAITDAADIDATLTTPVSPLDSIPTISELTVEQKAVRDWYSKLSSTDKQLYDAYIANPTAFDDDGVLEEKIYNLLKGLGR